MNARNSAIRTKWLLTVLAIFVLSGLAAGQSRFEKNQEDIITDSVTRLQWQVAQNRMNWNNASTWVESLGEGWRLPTREELRNLNESGGITARNWGAFANSGTGAVWQCNTRDSDSAWIYCFSWESGAWMKINEQNTVFAVRSR